MSITSALIASTIDKIKKDLSQLEDWLNSLHSGNTTTAPSSVHTPVHETDVSALLKRVEELTTEVNAQKHTIHHLVDRIDVMEETREIHIDGHLDDQMEDDPWLSGPTPLQNEIVDPTFFIHKTEEAEQPNAQIPSVVEAAPIDKKEEPVETKPSEKKVESQEEAQEEEAQEEAQEEEAQEEEAQEEEAQEEEAQEEEAHEEEAQEEEAQEEEAQEEEAQEEAQEEEGVELEEITVKGVNYYKDPEEGFIYEIDSEGQPSENPIGIWKTKTQTILFYRST
jgi:flagellar biosynthesis GTPase FlhF